MALTQYYVDPAIAANSGTGTIGDPYGDLQYALNTITRDSTNGDQVNIKAGTAEVLASALSLATYGSPSQTAPLRLSGYTSSANDGGIGEIDANGGAAISTALVYLSDLYIHNGGSSTLLTLSSGSNVKNCKIDNTSGTGIITAISTVTHCEITNCATGINASGAGALIYGNYFKAGGTRNFSNALNCSAINISVVRNIFSIGTSGSAILMTAQYQRIMNNSILASASTGYGIVGNTANQWACSVIAGNLIEGFSGAGGSGMNGGSTTYYPARFAGNAAYNNTTNYSNMGVADDIENLDNESLGATPFAKSGSDTFANRFVYFAPADTGNVYGGAIQ
jgi:hypothetical protein